MFFHDVPPPLAADAMRHARDQSATPLGTPWPLEAWPEVPTSVLICRDDRVFPAPFSRRVAQQRLGITPRRDRRRRTASRSAAPARSPINCTPTPPSDHRRRRTMTTPYTRKQLTDVQDSAPGFGLGDFQQVRFATADLDAETTGFAHLRINANMRPPFAHRHDNAEEVYVVLSGSGRVKLDDAVVDLQRIGRAARRAGGDARVRGRPGRSRAARVRPAPRERRRGVPGLVGRTDGRDLCDVHASAGRSVVMRANPGRDTHDRLGAAPAHRSPREPR